nr:MBOAT family protein [Lachnospiraceae bacterium]
EGNRITWTNFRRGFGLFVWGMFKKLVISDRAAIFVSAIWGGDLSDTAGSMILFSVFMFNLQLYTDFSGGIDMVSGVSQLFGIELAENFRRPFFSRTLAEYWRRWHMSLGAWIKDYVFYPIAMSKTFAKIGKNAKAHFGVHIGKTLPGAITSVITFVMIGLWHDITIPYVLYGVWHGLIMGLSTMFEPLFTWFNNFFEVNTECLSHRWFQRARTFLLVTFGEYFSLAAGFGVLVTIFKRTFLNFEYPALYLKFTDYGLDNKDWFVLLMATFVLIFISMKQESGVRIREALEKQELWFQWAATFGLIFVIMIFGIYGPGYDAASFIYGGF